MKQYLICIQCSKCSSIICKKCVKSEYKYVQDFWICETCVEKSKKDENISETNKKKRKILVDNDQDVLESKRRKIEPRTKRIERDEYTSDSEEDDIEDPISEGEMYEVEAIIDSKNVKGRNYYLIKWKGWDSKYNTVSHFFQYQLIRKSGNRERIYHLNY